jgi:hypothetical protein
MKKLKFISLVLLCICIAPLQVTAGDFDGKKPLLCATIKTIECGDAGDCQQGGAESINVPQFFTIDFKKKSISGIRPSGEALNSKIERMEHVDGKLILQGAEDGVEGVRDGVGWSMAIAEDTGKMVLTASGDQVGFVVFGACTLD